MNPFDYLNAINDTKQNVIEDSDNPELAEKLYPCLLYTSPSPRDAHESRMPSSA